MGEGAYRFAIRPAAVAHGHPVLGSTPAIVCISR